MTCRLQHILRVIIIIIIYVPERRNDLISGKMINSRMDLREALLKTTRDKRRKDKMTRQEGNVGQKNIPWRKAGGGAAQLQWVEVRVDAGGGLEERSSHRPSPAFHPPSQGCHGDRAGAAGPPGRRRCCTSESDVVVCWEGDNKADVHLHTKLKWR